VAVVEEQVNYLWRCGKCGTTNQEAEIFCLSCARLEGLPNEQAAPGDKTGKITEVLGNAIEWSLQNSQLKPADILGRAAKRGRVVKSIAELRALPVTELDRLADNFVASNRAGATGAGLGAGLPGGLAAFATIPADIAALVYFALRCVSGIGQSYSFEASSETGQTVELLAFAFSCRMDSFIIGQRRLENLQLAHFLLQAPPVYSQLAKACLLKQLAIFLTVDFAKTSWASFLPVVGSVVNGMDHFWFIGEVSKRSKIFYRVLLGYFAPPAPPPAPARAIPQVVTIEVSQEQLPLPGQPLPVYFAGPPQAATGQPAPPVLVLWEGRAGQELAEKLAEQNFKTLLPLDRLDSSRLADLLDYLKESRPDWLSGPVGLVAFGHQATAALELLAESAAKPDVLVLYNPLGASREITVTLPLLLHWSEDTPEIDKGWVERLRSDGLNGLISISNYPGVGLEFADPFSTAYDRQASQWAWTDTLEWLNRLAIN
jgi:hypothetical protein